MELKRTIFVGSPYHISAQQDQLVFENREKQEKKTVPTEDLGYLVLEHPHISITQAAIALMSKHNVAVVFCDEKYMPASILYHYDTHYIQTERIRNQAEATEPLKKQIWAQTIKAKIINQASTLDSLSNISKMSDGGERVSLIQLKEMRDAAKLLRHISNDVLSGDTGNREGQAARVYWKALFGEEFLRERGGAWPNPALNYGYIVLRAAMARAICGVGLLPSLGIFHRNKYNPFVLADDLMEPYRPYVDQIVWLKMNSVQEVPQKELRKEDKQILLQVLTRDVVISGQNSPLMLALQHTASSIAKYLEGVTKKCIYPEL